ncbi:nucleotide exchange factor GrpE [candidate division KSB1 bacterium]|nr:nucleotide exchange factor GrpE [candidate division KSB1 bacterium]
MTRNRNLKQEEKIKINDSDAEDMKENPLENQAAEADEHRKMKESKKAKADDAELKLASEYLEHLQRLQAEFTNYKKRVEREQAQFSQFIKSEFIKKLLPVLDDFQRFLLNHENDQNGTEERAELSKGFKLIYEKLFTLLKEEGLTPLETVGREFDPNLHEALMMENTDDETKDGKVLEEWEKGYMYKDNLLRVARVKVGKFISEAGDN